MKKHFNDFVFGCMSLALMVMAAAGCENASAPSAQTDIHTPSPTASAVIDPAAFADEEPYGPQAVAEPSASPDPEIEHEAEVSANHPKGLDPISGMPTPKPAPKPKVDEKDAYRQEKPTLMGLSIGMSKNSVLSRFGQAKSQFVLDEDTEPIDVYEYADFSVGFLANQELEFVDVHSPDIDPGLGGLRLGQKPEAAIAILGNPDTNSTYVLTYKSQGTLLKLDIDPKQSTIQSIKLFADR